MGQTLPGWLPEQQQASMQKMQPNVTAAVPAKSADNNDDDRSADAMTEQK